MKIFSAADNIISPLGFDTDQNLNGALAGKSGISLIEDKNILDSPFYGAQIKTEIIGHPDFTRLENLIIQSIENTLSQIENIATDRTILILSTTKGNIDLLDDELAEKFPEGRVQLPAMAQAINNYFQLPHTPILVSNACISGVSALLVAKRMIETGKYDHAIVSGGDLLSGFTTSGFNSLMAISEKPCQPYDQGRSGISLGEAAATMIVTNDKSLGNEPAEILGGGQSNDANHISGPSRTGEGLKIAVEKALRAAHVDMREIDYINAHGTATLFNDEMESIAFDRLGLSDKPINSLKGYFGHTLGAAGLLESILTIKQLQQKNLLASHGFVKLGTSKSLHVVQKPEKLEDAAVALKTVSGFGGCNAAILFRVL